jgi:hypothetical protein
MFVWPKRDFYEKGALRDERDRVRLMSASDQKLPSAWYIEEVGFTP